MLSLYVDWVVFKKIDPGLYGDHWCRPGTTKEVAMSQICLLPI